MKSMKTAVTLGLGGWACLISAGRAHAEPMFLARQYARCTTCHYSPTGGGLLTPYGRSLSRQELSSTGKSAPDQEAQTREEGFLWGVLGDRLGPLALGVDMRPAHLHVGLEGQSSNRDFFMTADVLAAVRTHGWTFYAELGRQPRSDGTKIDSYEHWVGYQPGSGLGVRVGRFLPAFGVRLADHTSFTRSDLGLDSYDQVYGLELSYTGERQLVQLSLSPGRADSIVHDDGRRAFTATARFQQDLGPRTALVVSGLFRDSAREAARSGAGGVAFGFAPWSRLSVWTEADALVREGGGGPPAVILLNDTSIEVFRGLWLKLSPQLLTEQGDASAGVFRAAVEADLMPRTHWHVNVSYYRDQNRVTHLHSNTFLAQLHLYL